MPVRCERGFWIAFSPAIPGGCRDALCGGGSGSENTLDIFFFVRANLLSTLFLSFSSAHPGAFVSDMVLWGIQKTEAVSLKGWL